MSRKQKKLVVPATAAPGRKKLNEELMRCKGGAHYNPKTDYIRAKEKSRERKNTENEGDFLNPLSFLLVVQRSFNQRILYDDAI